MKHTPLKRSAPLSRGTTRLRARNPERQAKRRKRYSALLAKCRRGEGYRQASARAQGQCEQLWAVEGGYQRCDQTEKLDAHHLTYARFGHELAEDLRIVCPGCHAFLESQHPTRRRSRA